MRRASAVLLALAVGCVPNFEDRTEVKDLRLLAVSADPPEVLIDVPAELVTAARTGKLPSLDVLAQAASQVAAQIPPVTVTPLVVDPRGGSRMVDYEVVACGNAGSNAGGGMGPGGGNPAGMGPGDTRDNISRAACPAGSLPLEHGMGSAPVRSEDGVAPMSLTLKVTPTLLAAAAAADPQGVLIGLPITLGFTLREGSEQVVGIKRVILMRRLGADQVANKNPVVPGLLHRPNKMTAAVAIMPGDPPLEVRLGTKVNLVAGPADAEAYRAPAISRTGAEIVEEVPKETLRYDFFATRGTFSPAQVSTDRSPLLKNQVMDLESTYEPPAKLMPGESPDVVVFVVVRDERGGASFTQTRLRLVGP